MAMCRTVWSPAHLAPRQSPAPGRAGTDCLPIACSRRLGQGISADRCSGLPRRPLRSTTSRSKPPHDRSAVRPEADIMNQTVRSRFTPPSGIFQTRSLRASSNSLNYRASNIRTKMAVVRLRRRKWAEREGKQAQSGPRAGRRGSDNLPGMAAFCGIPTADQERIKSVPTGRLGGGRGTVVEPSPVVFQWLRNNTG